MPSHGSKSLYQSRALAESNRGRSVIQRTIHSSPWPTLLRSDTAATIGVQKRVKLVTWLQTLMKILIAVAAIVTPLGLYDDVVRDSTTTIEAFHYVRDPSPMGIGYAASLQKDVTVCITDKNLEHHQDRQWASIEFVALRAM
jgi:hypothetical protein